MRRCLLAAASSVLLAGPVLAQTVTISPTEAQTLREGEALEVTLTVNGLTTGQEVSIDFPDTDRTASADDFEVYQQATEPTNSDTPVTLDDSDGYYYYIFATNSDPGGRSRSGCSRKRIRSSRSWMRRSSSRGNL